MVESGVELEDLSDARRNRRSRLTIFFSRPDHRSGVFGNDSLDIQQGGAFIEDAFYDRLTYHRTDVPFLKYYRLHISWYCQLGIGMVILILHMLAFFEEPTSLSLSTDIRSENYIGLIVPYPITELIEGCCLIILAIDCCLKIYGFGLKNIRSYNWHSLYALVLSLSFAGWIISMVFYNEPCWLWCKFRCFLRPLILLQHSALMKKALLCVAKSIPSMFSVFLLFFIHIILFTLIGLVIMPIDEGPALENPDTFKLHYGGHAHDALRNMFILLTTANNPDITILAYSKSRFYSLFYILYVAIGVHFLLHILFATVYENFRDHFRETLRRSILQRNAALVRAFEVLSEDDGARKYVPTDRMHRVIATLSIGYKMIADLKNCLEKIGKNNITITWKVFLNELFSKLSLKSEHKEKFATKSSLKFDPLLAHRTAMENAKLQISQLTGNEGFFTKLKLYLLFVFAHPWFVHFGSLVTVVNVCLIMFMYSDPKTKNFVETETAFCVVIYFFEQSAVAWALGLRVYTSHSLHRLDLITLIPSFISCIIFVVIFQGFYEIGDSDKKTILLVFGGATHILIGLRLLRVILSMKLPHLIFRTILDLLSNLAPFLGLLAGLYYFFAFLGMVLFAGRLEYDPQMENCWRFEGIGVIANMSDFSMSCPYGGGYHQRDFWSQNFNDFASSLVLLWNLMLVNNWDIIADAYSNAVGTRWAYIFFVIWYIVAVVMALTLLTAVIVANFIMRWSIFRKYEKQRKLQEMQKKLMAERLEEERFLLENDGHVELESRWKKGAKLRRERIRAALRSQSSRENNTTGLVEVPRESQAIGLVHVLDVRLPSTEEVRQHLLLTPYGPTSYAMEREKFFETFDLEKDEEDDKPDSLHDVQENSSKA